MFTLILLVIIGFGMAYFATQNILPVTITLANYTFRFIPLYVIVIGSLLIGVLLSWLISLVSGVSSFMTLSRKDSALRASEKQIESLKRENKDLSIENERLKGKHSEHNTVPDDHTHEVRPSFLEKLKHNLS